MARILLAEDYDDLREMISELLRGQDHVVEAFDNGADAHAVLKTKTFDLIILDWELPQLHGVEVIKDYRAAGGTSPVLLLSGRKALSDKETGFDAGADDYLTKPFHPKELQARIKALLRRAELSVPKQSAEMGEMESGTLFGDRYQIVSVLGKGSTGIIYKSRHIFLNRFVALKVLHPQLISDGESVARFKREAQAVSCLSHPNIIAVYDFGITSSGLPYLAMDYAEGETLAYRLSVQDHLSVEQALPIFIQAADALGHSHERGVIHRDVKPGNMLLVSNAPLKGESLKLVDFGIAKVARGGAAMQVTQNGDILGSPLYMSPEQCMGLDLDPRTDIYSLGCVMYITLTGKEPFVGDNVLDTMYRRTVEEVRPFSDIRNDLEYPKMLETIVLEALKRERNRRYQTMRELQTDLEALYCAIS
jgi:CheY-like chemotaxis protein